MTYMRTALRAVLPEGHPVRIVTLALHSGVVPVTTLITSQSYMLSIALSHLKNP